MAANKILTDLTALTTPASGDFFYTVDVSDSTDADTGTSKKITYTNFVGGILTELAITSTVAELNILDGVTSTAVELNILDGATLTVTELNYVDGVTSAIQTQMNLKAPLASPTFTGTIILPKTLEIQDTSADHQYVLAVSELAADRTVTLPLLTGNDDFVFEDHIQTLTNKRISPRVVTATDDATAVIDVDVTDQYQLTAVANATTFTVTGTPVNGQKLIIRLKDAGVGKGLTWDSVFRAVGVTLPTTTVASKTHYIGCIYNSADTKWDALAVVAEA